MSCTRRNQNSSAAADLVEKNDNRLSNKSKNGDFLKLAILPLKATALAFWTA